MIKTKHVIALGLMYYAGMCADEWGTYWYHEKYGRDQIVERYIDSVFDTEYILQVKALGLQDMTAPPHYFGGHELYYDISPGILFSDYRREAVTNEKGEIFFFSSSFSDKRNTPLRLSEERRIEENIRHEAIHSILARVCPNPRAANPGENLIHEGFAYLMENGTGKIDCSGGAGAIPVMGRIPEYA